MKGPIMLFAASLFIAITGLVSRDFAIWIVGLGLMWATGFLTLLDELEQRDAKRDLGEPARIPTPEETI
jgi:hypothetical protein